MHLVMNESAEQMQKGHERCAGQAVQSLLKEL